MKVNNHTKGQPSATPFGFGYFLCCKQSFTRFIINSECKGNGYEKTINAVNAYACSYGLDTGIDCRNIQYQFKTRRRGMF